MQWHSDVEYRLLKMFIVINPVIITAIIGVNEYINNKNTYFALTCSMAVFLIILTIFIDIKIRHEHVSYKAVGQDVVKIWEYFELFDIGAYLPNDSILPEEARKHGTGSGYKKTLYILWAMTITVSVLLIGFGYSQLIIK